MLAGKSAVEVETAKTGANGVCPRCDSTSQRGVSAPVSGPASGHALGSAIRHFEETGSAG
jgi:hypothetical protein